MNYMTVFDCHYTWRWMHRVEKYFAGSSSMDKLINILNQYKRCSWTNAAYFTAITIENSWNGTQIMKNMAKLL